MSSVRPFCSYKEGQTVYINQHDSYEQAGGLCYQGYFGKIIFSTSVMDRREDNGESYKKFEQVLVDVRSPNGIMGGVGPTIMLRVPSDRITLYTCCERCGQRHCDCEYHRMFQPRR